MDCVVKYAWTQEIVRPALRYTLCNDFFQHAARQSSAWLFLNDGDRCLDFLPLDPSLCIGVAASEDFGAIEGRAAI